MTTEQLATQRVQCIYERLINLYGENPNYDYMLALKDTIEWLSTLNPPGSPNPSPTSTPTPPAFASPTPTAGGSSTPRADTLLAALSDLMTSLSLSSLKATMVSGQLSYTFEGSLPTAATALEPGHYQAIERPKGWEDIPF